MNPPNTQFFSGEFCHKLDAKNRLTIPSDWRFQAEGGDVYLAIPNPIGCISVYPPKMVEKIMVAAEQSTLSAPNKQRALMALGRLACKVTCDKAGRISLDSRLLKHAAIDSDATLIGEFSKFHIWNPARLSAEDAKSQDLNDIFGSLAELGL